MRTEQRFFTTLPLFLRIIALAFFLPGGGMDASDRTLIDEGRVSLIVPDGWKKTELNAADVLAGYATQDNRSSVFFRAISPESGGGMQDILDATIANYEATFKVKEVSKAKTGDVSGPGRKWPGIFTTVEASVVKGDETFEMKFYLLVFETGSRLYLMQASTTLPVRESRERQIYELIRSLVAKE
jgi:hypothetical protein